MDPLTHTVLGASLGYAVFGRRLGRTAALAGALAALLPDSDIFIQSQTDPLLAIEHHRGFTHALPFAPIGAALAASPWLVRRAWRERWLVVWAAGLVAYVSHCLLDAATSYGTQLWWPFSAQRVGWDIISIIDPVFTLSLIGGLGLALIAGRPAPVLAALAFAGLYLGLGAGQHARAVAAQQQLALSRGHRPERHEVMPTLANLIIWRALYLYEGRIYSDRVRVGWFSSPAVIEGWSLPLAGEAELTPAEAARNAGRRSFQRFSWFSDGWVARSPDDPTVLGDMRYSLSNEAFDPIWGIRFTAPDASTEVVWVNRSRNRQIDLRAMWIEIVGGDPRYRPLPAVRVAETDHLSLQ